METLTSKEDISLLAHCSLDEEARLVGVALRGSVLIAEG